jgi:gliding motility-associated-like protein/uncharacterized repeat protein (TIGR01451 family)
MTLKHVHSFCLVLVVCAMQAQAQTIPFTERKKWDGPYDIKMIAAPNLEAVFIDSANAVNGRLKKDSVISNQVIQRTWNQLNINNRFKDGSPFVLIDDFPLPALACKDLDSPCLVGLNRQNNNSSCPAPNIRYSTTPQEVRRYVSMTYADYDTDSSTYSSSMARLEGIPSCSQVEAAYLYWTGNVFVNTGGDADPDITLVPTGSYKGTGDVFKVTDSSGFNKVLLKKPGGSYQTVTADTIYKGTRDYVCVAEVTDVIKGSGLGNYWVGNIQSFPIDDDGGSTSGWTLVIVARSPLSPPRTISLWDGFLNVTRNNSTVITMRNLQAPATSDFKSFVGYAMLDGENLASEVSSSATFNDQLGFSTTDSTISTVGMNPFAENVEYHYKRFNSDGWPVNASGDRVMDNSSPTSCNVPGIVGQALVFDGISSSKISSYNEVTKKNGAPITRLPNNNNTLGYDSHHLLLPDASVTPNSTFASLFVNAGPQGSTKPFMAYLAIERIQPKLVISKTVDTNVTRTEDIIDVRIRVINSGNDASLGTDSVYDVLDEGVDFVPGSVQTYSYVNGTASLASTDSVNLISSQGDTLQWKINQKILAGDSIEINFKVKVKDFDNNKPMWLDRCKRSIPYVAYVTYDTKTTTNITNASNALDCGPVSAASIQVVDTKFDVAPDSVGVFDATLKREIPIVTQIKQILADNRNITETQFADFRIYDSAFTLINSATLFPDSAKFPVYYAIRDNSSTGNCQTKFKIEFQLGDLIINIQDVKIDNLCSNGFAERQIITANDKPVYNGNLTFFEVVSGTPKNGTVRVDTTENLITYLPSPGFAGKDSVVITLLETVKNVKATKRYYFTVNAANLPPVVKNEIVFSTYRNQPITSYNLLSNDSDPNGDKLYLFPASGDAQHQGKLAHPYKTGDTIFFKNHYSDFKNGDAVYFGRNSAFQKDSIVLQAYNKLVDDIKIKPKRGEITINTDGTFTYTPTTDQGKDGVVRDTAVFWVCDYSTKTYCNPFFCRLDTVVFEIKPYQIFVPEGFSPNGDGTNDRLVIYSEVPLKVDLLVFNRWGGLVYESKDYKNDWDGVANKGVVIGDGVPDGTYYLHVNINDKELEQFKYITISR